MKPKEDRLVNYLKLLIKFDERVRDDDGQGRALLDEVNKAFAAMSKAEKNELRKLARDMKSKPARELLS
jgi:CHASE3 domain sensor protein